MISPHDISDFELYILHTTPWIDKLSPVFVKDAPDEVFEEVPVLRQVKRLLEILERNGGQLKLTPKGCLPGAVVNELYEIGAHDPIADEFYKSINREDKAPNVSSVRLLMIVAGLVRNYKKSLHIVKKNIEYAGSNKILLERLLYTYSTYYNIGYFDAYNIQDLHCESALIYLLLARYGDIWRPVSFYKNELTAMQPALDNLPSKELTRCLECRIFKRQMEQLGLVERNGTGWIDGDNVKIRRTPLFDRLIGIRTHAAPIIFHPDPIMS